MHRHPRTGLAALSKAARRRQGMTLVEIMVVITIIVTLMSVLAVGVIGYLDDANRDMTRITMGRIEQALTQYSLKHKNKYPSTGEGLSAVSKYMPDGKIPTDEWGNEFMYFSPGTHGDNPFEIVSLGKDGKEGGDGAAADIYSWKKDDEE